ncbi:hypothetical protein [Cellulomonas sp. NPDC089187]|uniref:hypothetical protein n=1 Tax=Cellulomonas sp. NPDC089187 TaxID=3154970 RepID=UPI00342E73C9
MLQEFTIERESARVALRRDTRHDLRLVIALLLPLVILVFGLVNRWCLLAAVVLCGIGIVRPLRDLPRQLRTAWSIAADQALPLTMIAATSALFLVAACLGIVMTVAADPSLEMVAAVCVTPLFSALWGRVAGIAVRGV